MKTLRGSILEESVPSAARHTTPRGLSPKRLLEFIMPELNLHCLRLASNSPKVRDTLLKLDEQGVSAQGRTISFQEGQRSFRELIMVKRRFWKGIWFSLSLFSPVGATEDSTWDLSTFNLDLLFCVSFS